MTKLILGLLLSCAAAFGSDAGEAKIAFKNSDYKKATELYTKAA